MHGWSIHGSRLALQRAGRLAAHSTQRDSVQRRDVRAHYSASIPVHCQHEPCPYTRMEAWPSLACACLRRQDGWRRWLGWPSPLSSHVEVLRTRAAVLSQAICGVCVWRPAHGVLVTSFAVPFKWARSRTHCTAPLHPNFRRLLALLARCCIPGAVFLRCCYCYCYCYSCHCLCHCCFACRPNTTP